MRRQHTRLAAFLVSASVVVLASAAARAQDIAPASKAQPDAGGRAGTSKAVQAGTVSEVVVVAQKRAENQQTVPVAITAFSGATLQRMGADSLTDYVSMVPSVSFASLGPDQTDISIRGLPLIEGEPTVGVYIDGISLAANFENPDPRLFDIKDVEILKGPQGTLYGEGAIGGLILIRTNSPDPNQFGATLDVIASDTNRSNRANDELNGMVNIPLIKDQLALRVVGYSRSYAGFIDQVSTGTGLVGSILNPQPAVPGGPGILLRHDANTESVNGGRVALAYTGLPNLDVVLTASAQELKTGADSFIMPATQALFFPTASKYSFFNDFATRRDDKYWQIDGQVIYDFHWATLTAVAGYNNRTIDSPQGFLASAETFSVPGVSDSTGHTFQTEVRLASATGTPFQWLVGGTYRDTPNDIYQATEITDAGFLRTVNQDSRQYAVFGEAAYTFSFPLTARFGLRYFGEDRSLSSHVVDPYELIAMTVPDQSGSMTSSAVSPRFVLEYRFQPDVMAYGSISRGFRSGGINVDLEPLGYPTPGFRPTYNPDSVWTYELGAKTEWFNHRLRINGALFYNDWQDLQIDGLPQNPGLGFTTNAGRAHSDGAELELTAVPIKGLEASIGGSVISAELDEAAMGAPKGSFLPNVPPYSVNASISYERPIAANLSAFIRADGSYRGHTYGNLPNIPQSATNAPYQFVFRNEALAFGNLNLRAGVETDRWSVTLFVENVTNGLESSFHFNDNAAFGAFGLFEEQEYIARPRTIGVELRASY